METADGRQISAGRLAGDAGIHALCKKEIGYRPTG